MSLLLITLHENASYFKILNWKLQNVINALRKTMCEMLNKKCQKNCSNYILSSRILEVYKYNLIVNKIVIK